MNLRHRQRSNRAGRGSRVRGVPRPASFAVQVACAWLVGGWWGIAWLWFVHWFLNNFTWIVNSACHWPTLGEHPHDTRDQSRNVRWLALVTHGESNHNAHHRHQRCAHHGMDGGPDLSWHVICEMETLGLASDVQGPPRERAPATPVTGSKQDGAPVADAAASPANLNAPVTVAMKEQV